MECRREERLSNNYGNIIYFIFDNQLEVDIPLSVINQSMSGYCLQTLEHKEIGYGDILMPAFKQKKTHIYQVRWVKSARHDKLTLGMKRLETSCTQRIVKNLKLYLENGIFKTQNFNYAEVY